jgi:Tfp pilus assembly PilM family ATPase
LSRYLAIDLDPQGLYVVAGSVRGGASRVEHALAWTAADGDGPPSLTTQTAREIGERLKEQLRVAGVAAAPVLVGVGRDKVILKELRYPAVPAGEEPALVRFQAMKEITENPDDVVLDYAPLGNGVAEGSAERRSMAVVVRKDVFAAIQSMCTAAGLKLAGVTPRPYAIAAGLTRAFATGSTQPPGDPSDAVAVLTPGGAGGEFTVVRLGQVTFTRAVNPQVLASEPLMLNEVRRNLAVYAGQNPDHPVQAVYVAEAEAAGAVWSGRLESSLAIPVEAYDPLAGAADDVAADVRGRFAGAVGLLAGRAADALPINFAAPRQPKVETDPRRKQLLLGALAFLILVVVGGGFGYMQLDAADKNLHKLQTEKKDLEDEVARREPGSNRLAEVDKWEARSVCWLDELFDMADRWPTDDQVRALVFDTRAIQPDKTGKSIAQAELSVKVGAKDADPVEKLKIAIDRDNTDRNKYYVGTFKNYGGSATASAGGFTILNTVGTKVVHRSPGDYIRHPKFTPPQRTASAPPPAASDDDDQ